MLSRTFVPAAALILAVSAGPALALYPPPVKDEAKVFSQKALEKANAKIKDIYKKYKKDVVIETYESLTAEQQKELEKETEKKFFPKFALKRIDDLGVNGVYLVLVKK